MVSVQLYIVFRGHGSLLKGASLLASVEEVTAGAKCLHPPLPAPDVGQIFWYIYPQPLQSGAEFDQRD